VRVQSLQRGGYSSALLNPFHARDPDPLLALELNGAPLHPDHGFPVRLIAPSNPGVRQTRWLESVTVLVSRPPASPEQPEPLAGWRWWTGLAVGGAVGLFGLAGLLTNAAATMPLVWLKWLVGLLLVHDFVLAPLVHLAGRRLRERTPEPWRWPLQLGLVNSGVLVLASVPVLVGVGRRTQPGNASVLPENYPLALAGVLTAVWLSILVLGIWGSTRRRSPWPGRREEGPSLPFVLPSTLVPGVITCWRMPWRSRWRAPRQ
jgi:Oxidoreductase molybdopterin binding domain